MSSYEKIRDIVLGKLVYKTIDADFDELSESVFGEGNCFARDEARKRFYGAKAVIDAVEEDKEAAMADDQAAILDEKKKEIRKEMQRFYDQRREYNKLLSQEGRWDHVCERLEAAADSLPETIGKMFAGDSIPDMVCGQNECVLVLSDWHYGMKTDNIYNTYNSNICKERVQEIVDAAIKRIRLHSCSVAHIVVLGDLIHGDCHVSARVASDEIACDQLMQASEILAQAIEEISHYVDYTRVYMTYGNHGRIVQDKKDSIHKDNIERIIPWWVAQRLKNYNNIEMFEGNGEPILYFNVCGKNVCASHGDIDSVHSSPRMMNTLFSKTVGTGVDVVILGDKHHRESFEELGITSMICGSLCGADDYSNDRRLYSTPSQLLLIFNPQDGLDAEYRIACR